MNAKSLIALAAIVASTGAFAELRSQGEGDFEGHAATAPVAGKTRAHVLADIAEARRTGELERIRGDYYGFEDAKPAAVHMARRAN
jgi:hypothetical protein